MTKKGNNKMTREEMTELLIEDRFSEWIYARCPEGLEDILHIGWKGYDNYTQQELEEAFLELPEEIFDDGKARKIKLEKLRIENDFEKPKK